MVTAGRSSGGIKTERQAPDDWLRRSGCELCIMHRQHPFSPTSPFNHQTIPTTVVFSSTSHPATRRPAAGAASAGQKGSQHMHLFAGSLHPAANLHPHPPHFPRPSPLRLLPFPLPFPVPQQPPAPPRLTWQSSAGQALRSPTSPTSPTDLLRFQLSPPLPAWSPWLALHSPILPILWGYDAFLAFRAKSQKKEQRHPHEPTPLRSKRCDCCHVPSCFATERPVVPCRVGLGLFLVEFSSLATARLLA
jgi:hypothetical protein